MHDKDTLKHAEERIVWWTVSFHPDVRRRKKKEMKREDFTWLDIFLFGVGGSSGAAFRIGDDDGQDALGFFQDGSRL